ncbi:MAG: hypothetical protein GY841_17910, partial [FCB group bacterium]|nr:hypothetical protein [FCB group bacterium]
GNSALTVDITARVATITIPGTDWNGAETVTFKATDPGALADSNDVVFTVTAINDAPVVTDIPDQTIDEGSTFTTINLDDYVSDVEDVDADMIWTYTGNSALTIDITARVATITIPGTDWNGAETVTFKASDLGALADSNDVIFTVTAINDAPVVTDIPDQTIDEGSTFTTINLDDYVSDVEDADADMTWTYTGNSALTVDITARVATITIPGTDWNGAETVTFKASDLGALADSNDVVFTVNAINDAPVVSDIPDQTIDEGSTFTTINLDDYVSDVDDVDTDMTWSYTGNSSLTVDITARVATITIPGTDWNGAETVTFKATDLGALADSNDVVFTVTAINDPPVVTDIPDQTIAEGESFTFINLDNYVSDIEDADTDMIWTYSGNTELTVSIVNRVAIIGTPSTNWNGNETITFRATDPSLDFGEDAVTFTVTTDNDYPVVTDIPDQTIDEGSTFVTISLDDYVSDVDNVDADMTWTYSGNSALTVDITARVATITIPNIDWNGAETITFRATDPGALFDEDAASFTVNSVNDAPIVADIPDQTIDEGLTFTTINLDDYVSDVDNTDDQMTWTYTGNSALTVDITARVATITIPGTEWNGAETVTFKASDPGALADSNDVAFTVTAINDAPVVTDIPDQTIDEGLTFTTINLDDYVSDVDNVDTDMTWSYTGNSSLTVDITARVATITIPGTDWNGAETVTFKASDPGALADSNDVVFTVNSINDAPAVTDIPDQTIDEGLTFTTINLDDYVSDVDHVDTDMTWTYSGNSSLTVDITARVATITIPGTDWNGAETVTFKASDPGALADSNDVVFTVNAVNDAPVVTDISDQTIDEGLTFTTINLDDYVSDVDNTVDQMVWTYAGNSALTVDITARIATITIPSLDWTGAETVTFKATDPGALADSNDVVLTVNAINDAPVVTDIPDQTIDEGLTFTTITLDDYVSDIDNTDAEMVWTNSGNTELTVDITARVATITIPSADWTGAETVTFKAADPGALADSNDVVFTVTNINDAPVVADIPDQTIDEGLTFTTINLDDYVSDVDNTDAEMTWTYTGNSALTVDITARVATITIPGSDWNGAETVTFKASDPGALADSNDVVFTVSAVNDAPVVTDIPDQSIAEGGSFSFINLDNYVSDVDDVDADMIWTYSGNVELTVSIINRVAIIGIPSADWNGSETITFRATDPGSEFGEDAAVFTVTGDNDAPIVADIPNQTIDEGLTFATISLDDYVSDIDNTDAEMIWTTSGEVALSISIDVNRVATITIPSPDWNGTETVVFRATDPSALYDEDGVTFTVNAVNDAPVVADIPDQTIDEGLTFTTINLDDFVSDVDNTDAEMVWSYSGNSALTVDITARVATITIPGTDWNGAETVTFRAADPSALADSNDVVLTVNAINDAPVVTDIPDQTIDEGLTFVTINLDDYVSDIDNTDAEMIWSAAGNTSLTVDITARVATITIPDIDWNGAETITFKATDPGALADSNDVVFTVNAINDAPVVTDIPDQTIDEGLTFTTISLDDFVSDIDNADAEMVWTYSGNTALTVDIAARVATITIPGTDWNGAETITFKATDSGALADSNDVVLTVNAVNDAPVVTDIPDQTIAEGLTFATINLDDFVSDVDNTDLEMTWTYVGNTELTVDITARVATITIPAPDWNGNETITFTASDPDLLTANDAATFTVTGDNDAPVVTDIPDQTIDEGLTFVTINLDDYVSDIDNTDAEMAWTAAGNTSLTVDITTRVATITIPDVDWNGIETITFKATDPGALADSNDVVFTVNAINDAPVVIDIPDQTIDEGLTFTTINLDDYVSDVDNVDTDMAWSYSGNSVLTVDIAARVATITIPSIDWNGTETVTFKASDPGALADSNDVVLTVNAVNDAPVVTDIPDQSIAEGGSFSFINLDDYVSDVDNVDTEMAWTFSGNIELAVSIVNRVAIIGLPTADWNGSETITFRATDPGSEFGEDAVIFTVTGDNDAPVVTDIPDQTIDEGLTFATINLDDYVSDIDNADAEIVWTYSGNSALTVDITARVATITIPSIDWNGAETITFRATDPGTLFDEDAATFTVNAVNDAPVVTDIPDQTIDEGLTFTTINLDDFVSDVDNSDAEMTWSYSGNIALVVDITARVATITIPSTEWNGAETVTFKAADPSVLADSNDVILTVNAINDAPVVIDIPDQTIDEGLTFTTINLDDFVSDIDNTDAEMTWSYSGSTELTVDITARVATITIPSVDWTGAETITFKAIDLGLLADSNAAVFTVTNINDAPIVIDIPDQTIDEGLTFTAINLDDFVSDIDNSDAEIVWTYSGNTELTVDITARVATIAIPDINWNGTETITFKASDPGLLADSNTVIFTVTAVNDNPVLDPIGGQTVAEGGSLNIIVTASDVDGSIPTLTTSILPTNAGFTNNGDGTGSFTFDPDFTQEGDHIITFYADDGVETDSEVVTITVTGTNLPPELAAIGNQTVAENGSLNLLITASDPDGTTPILTTSTLPPNTSFLNNGDGTANFDFTPDFTQAGDFPVTFYADDGLVIDSEVITITVTNVNRSPLADAGIDQINAPVGSPVTLDGSLSGDPDGDLPNYHWAQVGGSVVTLSDTNVAGPTFTPMVPDTYLFELIVDDGDLFSSPDTVSVTAINVASPEAIADLSIAINIGDIELAWTEITQDADGLPTVISSYIIYRGTSAYFTPTPSDSIGTVDAATFAFVDSDLMGADVVGDTATNYFYVVISEDAYGNRSDVSNRVGEFDYQIITTATTNFNLVCVPFENSGITTADDLIASIGSSNVLTVNNYIAASQSFESRFAAGFGVNFTIVPGGVYQVNAALATVFSVAGNVPAPGSISYGLVSTGITNFSFLTIPFEREIDFSAAQDVLDNLPGSFNTLNNYVAGSQSYESRFAAGFGVNFTVRAGRPYQANAAAADVFPGP